MGVELSTEASALLVGGLGVALYFGYSAALPKPLPDIPYNRDAGASLLGDMPEMIRYVIRTKRVFCWLTSLTERHQSPIVQAFVTPMSRPWLVVTDPFESQDILLRRTKDFDRAHHFGDIISGLLPEQHIQFRSSDARFKNNRALINHLMAPTFVSQVSAPEVYKSVCTLVNLWQAKCNAAEGRPWSPHQDITFWALDSIFASSFGLLEADSNTVRRLEAMQQAGPPVLPVDVDEPVSFPEGEIPEIFRAVLTLSDSLMMTQLSPAPRLTAWLMHKLPYLRRATATKDAWLGARTDEAVALIDAGIDSDRPRSALHSVLLRERDTAEREGRPPAYHKRAIADEFVGFMMAGHDTTATTVAWGLKMLTDHPEEQARLRRALREALPDAAGEGRAPTYEELTRAHIPYLDAVVDEVLRKANTIDFVVRVALRDTTVLGRRVPQGTDVFLMGNGAGYVKPALSVDDEVRSPGARRGVKSNARGLTGAWDDSDVAAFRPERWLRVDTDTGAETFDPMAGPTMAFGLGPRGCFGRRLAVQALRITFAMTVWHFELLPTPTELSGYDAVQRFAREPTQCFVRMKPAVI
ncbi:related to TRI13 - cytochrome P450 [Cephalotrichum gorgonifer]|uniref:Related to TRI13 - cytochrome P450 n=1 Tax=Cephalotrichum gorgonifer TaxID=2041049 RepID=A0AAE8MWF5_9PEZI|nr:related to TRI13 - cytochrome P450 [Cephalotrichum gorgonifer]